jgi:formate-dependent nitrite reductase membrane component NrfD
MMDAPSSTWFTLSPHWGWLITLYFFIGGLAGGSYFLATTIDLFGRREDRPLARLGYYIAFPAVLVSGFLLTIDLNRPERFWHMLVERNTFGPMFKLWSPMSVGSWALLIFGLFSFLSFIIALADDRELRWPGLRRVQPLLRRRKDFLCRFSPPSLVGRVVSVIGGFFGFFIAGYTGVLLAVTNRPIWSDTPLLGMLFIVSAASTSAALMLLLAHKAGWRLPGMEGLHLMDRWVIVLEFLVLAAVVVSLGPVLQAWLNAWGLLLLVGVVLVGMALPLLLERRPGWARGDRVTTVAVLVLIGGFLLRAIVVFSSESI